MAAKHVNYMRGETDTPRTKAGIGRRIYDWRKLHGVSLHALSHKSGVAYSLLWSLETRDNKRLGRVDTVEKLAAAMDVNPAWLLNWIQEG